MSKRIFAIGSFLLSGGVLIASSVIAFGYWQMPNQVKNLGDWMILLPPVIAPSVSLLLGILVVRRNRPSRVINGILQGAWIGASIYLLFPASQIFLRFELISNDGTAYWGLMMMPVIHVWVPLLLLGSFVGGLVGFYHKRKMTDQPTTRYT